MSEAPPTDDLEPRRLQMFPALSAEQMDRMTRFGSEVTFEDGAIVIERGDRHPPMFVVLEGQIEIVHPNGQAEERVVVHGRGQFTGEVSMLADRPSLVRARALGSVRAVRIAYERFRAMLQTDSDLSDLVMRAFILRRLGLLTRVASDVVLVGSQHSSATLRLQAFLVRNGHPYRYVDIDRDEGVQALLDARNVDVSDVPIVLCADDRVLRSPTDAELADCLGLNPKLEPGALHDLVVCGAGPGGLAAAVYGASEGLDVIVVEANAPGGQAAASSKIENYLGFPTGISGQALTARALGQAEKFGAQLVVASPAVKLDCDGAGAIGVHLANGEVLRARAVVVATGAEYRRLDVPDLAKFEGVGVYYAATFVEAQRCAEDEVVVVGGGNSAGQAATFLARGSRRVYVLVRGADLASSMSRYLIRRIEESPNIELLRRTSIVRLEGGEHLERVTWRDDATRAETTRPIRHVFTMAGAAPNTAWLRQCVALDARAFVRTGAELDAETLREQGWPLDRRPYLFETSRPRVFAIGDVRSDNVKRVASAVGEGSVCVQLIHKALAE